MFGGGTVIAWSAQSEMLTSRRLMPVQMEHYPWISIFFRAASPGDISLSLSVDGTFWSWLCQKLRSLVSIKGIRFRLLRMQFPMRFIPDRRDKKILVRFTESGTDTMLIQWTILPVQIRFQMWLRLPHSPTNVTWVGELLKLKITYNAGSRNGRGSIGDAESNGSLGENCSFQIGVKPTKAQEVEPSSSFSLTCVSVTDASGKWPLSIMRSLCYDSSRAICLYPRKGSGQRWRRVSGPDLSQESLWQFIYPVSDLYGGLAGTWDYGHLGCAQTKYNELWWKMFVSDPVKTCMEWSRRHCSPSRWRADGRNGFFRSAECKKCKQRFHADHLDKTTCPWMCWGGIWRGSTIQHDVWSKYWCYWKWRIRSHIFVPGEPRKVCLWISKCCRCFHPKLPFWYGTKLEESISKWNCTAMILYSALASLNNGNRIFVMESEWKEIRWMDADVCCWLSVGRTGVFIAGSCRRRSCALLKAYCRF